MAFSHAKKEPARSAFLVRSCAMRPPREALSQDRTGAPSEPVLLAGVEDRTGAPAPLPSYRPPPPNPSAIAHYFPPAPGYPLGLPARARAQRLGLPAPGSGSRLGLPVNFPPLIQSNFC